MTEQLSEFVDLFPTLAEAAGLPKIPVCPEHDPYSVSIRQGSLRGPGGGHGGIMTEQLSEFVDLFPTLAEAAGLPKIPVCPEKDPYSVSL